MMRRLLRRREIVPQTYEPTHKYYGFFPTTNLLNILPVFDGNDSVDIQRIQGERVVQREKKTKRVLPYITRTDYGERSVVLQFDSIRHGKLPVRKAMRTLGGLGTDLMAVDELDVMLPGDRIPFKPKRKAPIVAMLRSHFEHGPDAAYKKELEGHITPEEFAKGLVRSSLDLMHLQDYAHWARGSRNGFFTPDGRPKAEYVQYADYTRGVTEDVEVVEKVMETIDPQHELRHIRSYERGKGDVWKLTAVW